jgi:YD repeat-containing protein
MKTLITVFLLMHAFTGLGQYYYRDIIGTKESMEMVKNYRQNKVSRVILTSYDADNMKNDEFYVEQKFNAVSQTLRTTTRSGLTDESVLTSYINDKGEVIKTVDSSAALVSRATYSYTSTGSLSTVLSESVDSAKKMKQSEEHKWEYSEDKITRMLRIKNAKDTSIIQFKSDDDGNITEEVLITRGKKSEPVYYFYDSKNRLTDIVRYNTKAKRLLPEYMFEYSPANQVIQRITVPSNGSNYLIWRYQYDANGLKIKEAIYDKQKQLTGKIEYQYQKG